MLDITICKRCGVKLTKERVVKQCEYKYRVWCNCGKENWYYKDIEGEIKRMEEREKARLEKETEVKND